MKEKMVVWFIGMMLERVNSEEMKKWLLSGTAMLRNMVIASPNKYDDMVVLPLLDAFEGMLGKE